MRIEMDMVKDREKLWVVWKTLAVFLVGLYFSASTLTAFPGLHNHSGMSGLEAEHTHGGEGHEDSKPAAPATHDNGNCQVCQLHSALGDSVPPFGPSFSPDLRFQFYVPSYPSPRVQRLLVAELHSRGPPLFPSA